MASLPSQRTHKGMGHIQRYTQTFERPPERRLYQMQFSVGWRDIRFSDGNALAEGPLREILEAREAHHGVVGQGSNFQLRSGPLWLYVKGCLIRTKLSERCADVAQPTQYRTL